MSDRELIGIAGIVLFFVLILFKARVAIAMIIVGILGTYALSLVLPYVRFDSYIAQYKSLMWENFASYELSVIPLFILMGHLASQIKLAQDLFGGMNVFFGRFKGGVAMTAVGACAGFGAVSGSSLATASTMGKIAMPELSKLGYSPRLSTGTLAAGGTLGILIPPSIALILYAIVVEASIIEMFQAAIIPGLIAVSFFMLTIAILVKLNPSIAPKSHTFSKLEKIQALKKLIPVILSFGSIILGLALGIFTPTPAAGAGVFIMLAYGLWLRSMRGKGKGLTFGRFKLALLDTAVASAMIYFILFGAEVLKGFFSRAGLPQMMADWAIHVQANPWLVLIALLALLILLGFFMESMSMILVVVPFIWPVLINLNGGEYVTASDAAFGMNLDDLKIWFGILALIVIELGLITPPVGLNVFIISKIVPDIPMSEIFKGVMPFFCTEIIRVALLLIAPIIVLAMPMWLNS